MLTAGVIGGPLIGEFQEKSVQHAIEEKMPGVYPEISREDHYVLGTYTAVDASKVAAQPEETAAKIAATAETARQRALASVTIFPGIMLLAYLGLILWFRSRGGYKPVDLGAGTH